MEDNGYTRTLLKQLFGLIIDEKQESSSIKFKKKLLRFLKSLIIFASAISGKKLIFEETILIHNIKDNKGSKKPKYEFPSIMIGEANIFEKIINIFK